MLAWQPQQLVFFDRVCISQSDPELQREALISLGGILKTLIRCRCCGTRPGRGGSGVHSNLPPSFTVGPQLRRRTSGSGRPSWGSPFVQLGLRVSWGVRFRGRLLHDPLQLFKVLPPVVNQPGLLWCGLLVHCALGPRVLP